MVLSSLCLVVVGLFSRVRFWLLWLVRMMVLKCLCLVGVCSMMLLLFGGW